jgi:hypothetical protein
MTGERTALAGCGRGRGYRDAVIPLRRAAGLTGLAQAAAATRDAIDVVLGQRAVQVDAARLAAAGLWRGARASAMLDGASAEAADETGPTDPVVRGARRVAAGLPDLSARWQSAPLQVLARLHVLAAADLADEAALGRPRDATSARRLTSTIAEIDRAAGPGSSVPAIMVASVVHAEVAEAFSPAGGVVGRAAERVVLAARGVDPSGVLVPEEGFLAERDGYADERARLLTGTDEAVALWFERCARAYTAAAEVTARMLVER